MRTETIPGTRYMAEALQAADNNFAAQLEEHGDLPKGAGAKLVAFYAKHKLAKRDHMQRRYNVKHGALLNREVVRRAYAQVTGIDLA